MTRKDLRNLLRLAKDIFSEMGRLRAVVNDVTLDPSNAARVLAAAKDDGTITTASAAGHPNDPANKDRGAGWIAPITKLFVPSGASADSSDTGGLGSNALRQSSTAAGALSTSARAPIKRRPPPRPVPKLAAAVSSSATTVNVEFSSSRARRAVSSTAVASSDNEATPRPPGALTAVPVQMTKPRRDDLFGIFAGAPPKPEGDSWVVLPRDMPKKLRGTVSTTNFGASPSGADRRVRRRLSRNVDAIVDNIGRRHGIIGQEDERALIDDAVQEEDEDVGNSHDFQETILERTRTLRPRGLSDSSIRSTFLAAGGENGSGLSVNRLVTPASLALTSTDTSTVVTGLGTSFGAFDRQNVLKNLSKKMQSFASYYVPGAGAAPNSNATSRPTSQAQAQAGGNVTDGNSTTALPRSTSLPTASSSPPRPIQLPVSSPARSLAKRGRRNPGTSGSPSSSSPGRIPVLSNLLAAVVDPDWPENEQEHAHPRRTQDGVYDRNWGRRDRF